MIKYFCDKCGEHIADKRFVESRSMTGRYVVNLDGGPGVNLCPPRHFHENCYEKMSADERAKAVEPMSIADAALDALNKFKEPFQ